MDVDLSTGLDYHFLIGPTLNVSRPPVFPRQDCPPRGAQGFAQYWGGPGQIYFLTNQFHCIMKTMIPGLHVIF